MNVMKNDKIINECNLLDSKRDVNKTNLLSGHCCQIFSIEMTEF